MAVRQAILGLLAQKPRHGYELRAAFEALAGGEDIWDVKPAQIYTTLARLEETGQVMVEGMEQDGGPEKRIYAITPTGKEALCSWLEVPVKSEHQRDEFFIKLMISLATRQAEPRRVIQIQRASLYQELHAITAQRSQTDPQRELAHILLLDQAVMRLEADLRWLEMVDGRLEEIRQQPLPQPEIRPRGRPPRERL